MKLDRLESELLGHLGDEDMRAIVGILEDAVSVRGGEHRAEGNLARLRFEVLVGVDEQARPAVVHEGLLLDQVSVGDLRSREVEGNGVGCHANVFRLHLAEIDSGLPQFDTDQRVAKLRLAMKNTDRRLLPGMTVDVMLRKPLSRGLTVSTEAVVESGINPRVFVQRGDGALEARPVTTGWSSAGRVQILSGLRTGEKVVSAGAFLIDSESRMMQGAP